MERSLSDTTSRGWLAGVTLLHLLRFAAHLPLRGDFSPQADVLETLLYLLRAPYQLIDYQTWQPLWSRQLLRLIQKEQVGWGNLQGIELLGQQLIRRRKTICDNVEIKLKIVRGVRILGPFPSTLSIELLRKQFRDQEDLRFLEFINLSLTSDVCMYFTVTS